MQSKFIIKFSYIKRMPDGKYRVVSDSGKNLGTYPSRLDAVRRLRQILIFKHRFDKKASTGKVEVDLTDIDGFYYSAIVRKLRQNESPEILLDFQVAFKKVFDLDPLADQDAILTQTLKIFNTKHSVKVNDAIKKDASKEDKSAKKFAKVTKNLYRGGAPSVRDVISLQKKLHIKKIVSLDYESGAKIDRVCKLLGIEHVMFPIMLKQGKSLARFPDMDWKKILLENGPTYIHCLHGKDRTGFVIALLRCQMGWSVERALEEANHFDFCVGLPEKIHSICVSLLNKVYGSDINNSYIPMNDSMTNDSIINPDYDPGGDPSDFNGQIYDGVTNLPYGNSQFDRDESYGTSNSIDSVMDKEEYSSRSVGSGRALQEASPSRDIAGDHMPQIGTLDNYTSINGFDSGTGYNGSGMVGGL